MTRQQQTHALQPGAFMGWQPAALGSAGLTGYQPHFLQQQQLHNRQQQQFQQQQALSYLPFGLFTTWRSP